MIGTGVANGLPAHPMPETARIVRTLIWPVVAGSAIAEVRTLSRDSNRILHTIAVQLRPNTSP